ncbi:MAG TPA: rod shape-determining protein MreC [Egibacteraceae bacterium]|jgi:rod shape-determining protein MreC|nr:rod shape-determining protein MreC [Egibacteraceae bacterium]
MPDRRRNPTMLAVLVLVSLVLLTVDYRQGDGGAVAAVQRGAMAVFGPVQEGFAGVVRPVGSFFASVADLRRLRDENAAQAEELKRLREARLSEADLERQNRELRAQLAMRDRLGFTTTGAQVIAEAPGAFEWTVLIDSGADSGLRQGMAVLNEDGLVGKVVAVTRSHARVQLVSSPQAGYVVKIADSGAEGFLSGRGSRPYQLDMANAEMEVEPGAEVVTYAFRGSSIPDGIPVGVVEEHPQTREAGGAVVSVRPHVNFARLGFVQIVLDAPVHPDDLDPEELVEGGDPPRPPPMPPRHAPPADSPEQGQTQGQPGGDTNRT